MGEPLASVKKLWTERFLADMASFNGDPAKHLARTCRYTVPCVLTTLTPMVGDESRLEQGLTILAQQFGASSRVSQALRLLVVHSLVASADRANLLMVATSVLNALKDTNMEALESAIGTNAEEVGRFLCVLSSGLNDICTRHSSNFSGPAL